MRQPGRRGQNARRPPTWPRQRQQVGRWARGLLTDPSLLVLDIQTAGLGAQAWAVQIAALDNQGRTLVDELLNPGLSIPAEASRLHGITDAAVARAPSFGDLLPELRGVVKGRRCIATTPASTRASWTGNCHAFTAVSCRPGHRSNQGAGRTRWGRPRWPGGCGWQTARSTGVSVWAAGTTRPRSAEVCCAACTSWPVRHDDA
ncbi:3'-5' exonuclease [Streptomyces gardneri]|nr:3'-5' exonuclease [Streptomyces gardneri]